MPDSKANWDHVKSDQQAAEDYIKLKDFSRRMTNQNSQPKFIRDQMDVSDIVRGDGMGEWVSNGHTNQSDHSRVSSGNNLGLKSSLGRAPVTSKRMMKGSSPANMRSSDNLMQSGNMIM